MPTTNPPTDPLCSLVVKQRMRAVVQYRQARRKGCTVRVAAMRAGASPATLWRWGRALATGGPDALRPGKSTGRRSVASRFEFSTSVLNEVRLSALRLGNAAAAWLQFAGTPACPPALAQRLRKHGVPESLLKLVAVERRTITIHISGVKVHVPAGQITPRALEIEVRP